MGFEMTPAFIFGLLLTSALAVLFGVFMFED